MLSCSMTAAMLFWSACGKGSQQAANPGQQQPNPQQQPARTWPPARDGYTNPVPIENGLAGDAHWVDGSDALAREIEGYADRISARAGDTVAVHVSSSASSTATWMLYRLGWYGGAGARLVQTGGPVPVVTQGSCPMEPGTGLVRCNWTTTFSLQFDSQAVSGLYALKLVRQDGKTRFMPIIVIDDRSADLLFQASVQTYEAYNAWGGESLYQDGSRTLATPYATKVSFDRPFDSDRGLGQMLSWEISMARFLERNGYDVTYAANLDLGARGPQFVQRAGMFLSVGHDEYWAGEERDTIETALRNGVPLAFFSSNTSYWKVRYEDKDASGLPRTMVCYKSGADPQGPAASGLFRGSGIGRPENALIGVMYGGVQFVPFSFVVADPSQWLFEGTGLGLGDALPGLVGYEFDRRFQNDLEPAGVTVLGRSPVVDESGTPGRSEAIAYRAQSGALVFASGTLYWSRGLDPKAVPDVRVERMTANVFHDALGILIPDGLKSIAPPSIPVPIMGPFGSNVVTMAQGLNGPAGLAQARTSSGQTTQDVVVALPGAAQIVVASAGGTVTPLSGDGQKSVSAAYDDVPGNQARFVLPVGVVVDRAGRVYVVDSGAHVIRRIDSDPAHTTTTLAGALGVAGFSDGQGAAARFSNPGGIAIDDASSTLYVADTFNHRVRAIDLATATVTTLAGSVQGDLDGAGATARLTYPTGIAAAPDGRIFVVSATLGKLKVIQPDSFRTVVTLTRGGDGFRDGAGKDARLSVQGGLAWGGGFLAAADGSNLRVRAISPGATAASTTVTTLAFSGRFGLADGTGAESEIGMPAGVAASSDGLLYVSDAANGTIRVVSRAP
jgi:hypothetical protein